MRQLIWTNFNLENICKWSLSNNGNKFVLLFQNKPQKFHHGVRIFVLELCILCTVNICVTSERVLQKCLWISKIYHSLFMFCVCYFLLSLLLKRFRHPMRVQKFTMWPHPNNAFRPLYSTSTSRSPSIISKHCQMFCYSTAAAIL